MLHDKNLILTFDPSPCWKWFSRTWAVWLRVLVICMREMLVCSRYQSGQVCAVKRNCSSQETWRLCSLHAGRLDSSLLQVLPYYHYYYYFKHIIILGHLPVVISLVINYIFARWRRLYLSKSPFICIIGDRHWKLNNSVYLSCPALEMMTMILLIIW